MLSYKERDYNYVIGYTEQYLVPPFPPAEPSRSRRRTRAAHSLVTLQISIIKTHYFILYILNT